MHIDILRIVPFTWIVFFATGVVELLLGFLMGYAVIQRFVLSGSAGRRPRARKWNASSVAFKSRWALPASCSESSRLSSQSDTEGEFSPSNA
jgi:hypothetical protein